MPEGTLSEEEPLWAVSYTHLDVYKRQAIKNAGGVTTLGEEIAWLKKYTRLQQEKLGKEIQIFCRCV